MKLTELKTLLREHPSAYLRLVLPDGDHVPTHFHITEVGHVTKRFIDCGGRLHEESDTCLLQTWVADDVDHRLDAGTFAKILDLGKQVLPHDDLEVEVEYEDCAVTQFPVTSAEAKGEVIELRLGEKHTDCLARQQCGIDGKECGTPSAADKQGAASCC
jgi:hypothetical protein